MRHVLTAVVVAVLVCASTAALAAEEADSPTMFSLVGAGPVLVMPFDQDYQTFGALSVSLKALPVRAPEALTLRTTPQYLAANLSADVIFRSADYREAFPGASFMLYEATSNTPVRVGITRPSGEGWSAYFKVDLPLGG